MLKLASASLGNSTHLHDQGFVAAFCPISFPSAAQIESMRQQLLCHASESMCV